MPQPASMAPRQQQQQVLILRLLLLLSNPRCFHLLLRLHTNQDKARGRLKHTLRRVLDCTLSRILHTPPARSSRLAAVLDQGHMVAQELFEWDKPQDPKESCRDKGSEVRQRIADVHTCWTSALNPWKARVLMVCLWAWAGIGRYSSLSGGRLGFH